MEKGSSGLWGESGWDGATYIDKGDLGRRGQWTGWEKVETTERWGVFDDGDEEGRVVVGSAKVEEE